MVRCAVTLDTSFAQCWNGEYRTVNKTTLLNSACIIPLRKNNSSKIKGKLDAANMKSNNLVGIFINISFKD